MPKRKREQLNMYDLLAVGIRQRNDGMENINLLLKKSSLVHQFLQKSFKDFSRDFLLLLINEIQFVGIKWEDIEIKSSKYFMYGIWRFGGLNSFMFILGCRGILSFCVSEQMRNNRFPSKLQIAPFESQKLQTILRWCGPLKLQRPNLNSLLWTWTNSLVANGNPICYPFPTYQWMNRAVIHLTNRNNWMLDVQLEQ